MVPEKVLIGAVIFFASLLQGMFGFAFMLVALPLLSFLLDIKVAVPLLSLFLALVSGILAFQLRGKFDYRNTISLLGGAVAGIPIGILFLLQFSDKFIKITLGALLIVYSAYSLFVKRIPFVLPGWAGYIFGFFAGTFGGAFNITGPPVILYVSAREWSKTNIAGSLNFFFCTTSILILLFHMAVGNISREITMAFLELTPLMIAGMLTGTYLFRRMNEDSYRKGLFALLIVMGIMLIL